MARTSIIHTLRKAAPQGAFHWACLVTVALALLLSAPGVKAEEARWLGVAACASPVCHGAAAAGVGSRVSQNEYLVWVEQDPHARAYRTLLGERSVEMARNLGIDAAETSESCLPCHATNAPEDLRGERFALADGVGCESCHGASSGWLEGHDDPDVSRERNVADGMVALDEPRVRAERCLACHSGAAGSDITHRIMAAGHPRLAFELDAFTWLAPAHFRIDDDYVDRKRADEPVVVWALGQLTAVRTRIERLADAERSKDGAWPELVMFECESCHHPMGAREPGSGSGLGFPRLERSSWTMLHSLLTVLDPDQAVAAGRRRDSLVGAATAFGHRLGRLATEELGHLESLKVRLDGWRPTDDELRALLARIVAPEVASSYRGYAEAEQAVLAVQAVAATLASHGLSADGDPLQEALDGLFGATADESNFDPSELRRALAAVREQLP